jgi:polysaccharide deacetylase family protein (PEP-CTERM system associated)
VTVTFTIDLEDPTEAYSLQGRYAQAMPRILDMCDEYNCRATVFTTGRAAKTVPKLIQEVAARGHEVAYHSHNHLPLPEENTARFREETKADKNRFEQLIGKPVLGYRAPRFSLTPDSAWALDILKENGFEYSSSIMPTSVSLFGFPNTPHTPFKWPNGLIEFPLPVKTIGKFAIPYLGGVYLYLLPTFLTDSWRANASPKEALWTYAHPYDLDNEAEFPAMPHTPGWVRLVLKFAHLMAEKKIRHVLAEGTAAPLGERATIIH